MYKQKTPLPPTPPAQTATATAGIHGIAGKLTIKGSPAKAHTVPLTEGAPEAAEMPAASWALATLRMPSISRTLSSGLLIEEVICNLLLCPLIGLSYGFHGPQ